MADGAQVLVLEDDAVVTLVIKTVLGRAGFAVEIAPDGRQGLRAFHRLHPEVVLLDVGLPEMDGWQVLIRIREVTAQMAGQARTTALLAADQAAGAPVRN